MSSLYLFDHLNLSHFWYAKNMFWVTFQLPYFSTIFVTSGKKILDPNGPYISTFQTIKKNCLSVGRSACRSVCHASTAYTSVCRGLKYLLKVRYIILNYPNVARFLIFETLCLRRAKTLTYVWKKFTKMNGIWVW